MEKITIPLSRGKILWLILVFTLVLLLFSSVLALWFLNRLESNLIIVAIISPILIVYLFFAWLCIIIKLLGNSPGLIIDQQGIFHNSAAASVGMIRWNDISSFRVEKQYFRGIHAASFITLELRQPLGIEYYESGNLPIRIYKRLLNPFQRSEVKLGNDSLQIDFAELVKIIEQKYQKYGRA